MRQIRCKIFKGNFLFLTVSGCFKREVFYLFWIATDELVCLVRLRNKGARFFLFHFRDSQVRSTMASFFFYTRRPYGISMSSEIITINTWIGVIERSDKKNKGKKKQVAACVYNSADEYYARPWSRSTALIYNGVAGHRMSIDWCEFC